MEILVNGRLTPETVVVLVVFTLVFLAAMWAIGLTARPR